MCDEIRYLPNGQKVYLVEEIKNGFLVQNILQYDEDEEPRFSEHTYLVPEVSKTEPTLQFSEKVLKLQSEIEVLTQQKRDAQRSRQEEETAYKERIERLAVLNPTLLNLERIINLEHTHFAIFPPYGTPDIIERDEKDERNPDGWWESDFELMRLTTKRGKLSWRLSKKAYVKRDSYDTYECVPCMGHEEAVTELQTWIDKKIAGENLRGAPKYIDCADKYGLTLPTDYRSRSEVYERKLLQESAQKAKEEFEKRQAELTAHQGKVPA